MSFFRRMIRVQHTHTPWLFLSLSFAVSISRLLLSIGMRGIPFVIQGSKRKVEFTLQGQGQGTEKTFFLKSLDPANTMMTMKDTCFDVIPYALNAINYMYSLPMTDNTIGVGIPVQHCSTKVLMARRS